MRSKSIQTVTEIQVDMIREMRPPLRGQHFKMHGCVDATFEVLPVASSLRKGIFATPRRFDAVIRFSNGGQQDDREPDVHGMAIKVLGVPGPKAHPDAPENEQDFILTDHPVFFIRTGDDCALFMESHAKNAPLGKPPVEFIEHLSRTHPEDLAVMQAFSSQIASNPLTSAYWSQLPFAFGRARKTACRYHVVPRSGTETGNPGDGPDYLRERMVARLAGDADPMVFDFKVQVRTDADQSVIDNPTVTWDLPFVTVATVTIAPCTFDTRARRAFGDSLRFSPWQALAAHRPLGEINAIRKSVYSASQAERAGCPAEAAATRDAGKIRESLE